MKKLTNILEKGDLTARERIMLVIKNSVHQSRTGEDLFEESELHAISERWTARNNHEAREYNKYLDFWKNFRYLKADMQTLFLNAQMENADVEKMLTLFYYNKDIAEHEDVLQTRMMNASDINPFTYILENTGIEYKLLLHTYTFLSLSKDIQKDILLLNQYTLDDHYYWGQQEQLTSVMRNKTELSEEDVSKLAVMVMDSMGWEKEKIFEDSSMVFAKRIFSGHFGGLPFSYLAERMAAINDIDIDDEDLYEQLNELPNLKNKLLKLLKQDIQDGLFTDYYAALCNSDSKETYGENTKLKHSELMTHWIKTKQKVTDEIQGYIDSGQFELKTEVRKFGKISMPFTLVVGEGIYHADKSLLFVKEYRKQADKLMIYGYLFKMIAESKIYSNYAQLLEFREVSKKVGEIVEADVSDISKKYISAIEDAIETHNIYIRGITSVIEDEIFECREYSFYLHSFLNSFKFDLSDIQPEQENSLKIFHERTEDNLRGEWTSLSE